MRYARRPPDPGLRDCVEPAGSVVAGTGGTLRVIDPSVTKCKSSETRLTWNVAGQQGLQGPEGPAGQAGPGVAYADRIEEDCPTCGPGAPVGTDWEGEESLP